MDVVRKDVKKRKVVRMVTGVTVVVLALGGSWYGLKQLKPQAPGVETSTLWPDTVRRGPMIRDISGLGTLVPEDTMLIPATTEGRVQKILVRPGAQVRADTVVMILTSPDLETALQTAEFNLKAAEADYSNLKVTLQKTYLDMQAAAAQVEADSSTARLEADRDSALAKENLLPGVDAKISATKALQLQNRFEIEKKRLGMHAEAERAQLEAQRVKVEQLRAQSSLIKSQVAQLQVRAGFDGTLQALPPPMTNVEVGQRVAAGTPLGKVAQPTHLKAELKIAETQIKDVAIGQLAMIDTRLGANSVIEGRVSRIDPSILNGTVTVDVALQGALPPGAKPDLSVDGRIQLEKLDDVMQVGRPVFGQPNATVQIFKYEPDGKYANKVRVTFGKTAVNTIEITDGLKVGDRVILSDMSAYDAYDRIKLN